MSSMRCLVRTAVALLCAIPVLGRPAAANPVLLFEPATGEVLLSEMPDETWFPASLTKMMTAYLTFEAVKTGRLAWDTDVPLSDKARAQPATRIGLRGGIKLNVEQAVRGLILRSANDFAMALAEVIAGSEEQFADLQNATAKRLGMTRTHFKNPHGLPDPEQTTTARDMAILAAAIHRDFPDRAEVFSTPEVQIHRQVFHSQNDLLRTLAGADGMKTGFTCGAGYNVVASATRNGRRLIAVVMGALTRVTRSQQATELLEKGFAHLDGSAPLHPVALKDLAMTPAEPTPVHDMSKLTATYKCGNRGGARAIARAGRIHRLRGAAAAAAGAAAEAAGSEGEAADGLAVVKQPAATVAAPKAGIKVARPARKTAVAKSPEGAAEPQKSPAKAPLLRAQIVRPPRAAEKAD